MKVEFKKSGYLYGNLYIKRLGILFQDEEFWHTIGRETLLAQILDKYFLNKDFLNTNKRRITISLSEEDCRLLKGILGLGSQSWHFWDKAFEENWSKEELRKRVISKFCWKVL